MKKRLISALLSTTLFAAAALAGVPLTNKIAYADNFVKTEKNTTLGTGSIGQPTQPGDATDIWKGSYVWYGKFGGNPVKYRVLDPASNDFGGNTMLLDCDSILEAKKFDDTDPYSNVWANSELKTYLNGTFLISNFTAAEQNAIFASNKESSVADDGKGNKRDDGSDWLLWAPLKSDTTSKDKIFLLDAKEATRPSYGYWDDPNGVYAGSATRAKTGVNGSTVGDNWWWLRSPCDYSGATFVGLVDEDGGLNFFYVYDGDNGVSPAFNVNLSRVLFSSVVNGKASGATGAEYKLTVNGGDGYSAKVTDGKEITREGKKVTVPFTASFGDESGTKTVSVLMTDGEYKDYPDNTARIKYYGRLNISGTVDTSGEGTFTLPTDYDSSWKTYILAEKVNGEHETDYASEPALVTIPCTITTESLPDGKVGTAYNQTLKARDTSGDVKWEKESGNLPDGLSLSEDGKISGTPEKTGTFTFTVKVTANNGSDTKELSIKVSDKKPDKCTITFDANGGKGEMDAQEVEKNKATKFNKNEYTRDGYTFKEWNTKTDGSGESYKDEASIIPKGDMTLYAQWTKGDDGKEKARSEGDVKVKLTEETLKILNDSLDPDLKKKVDEALAEGKEVDFVFSSKYLGNDAEGAKDISGYSKDKGYTIGEFFDLSLDVRIDGETVGSISNTSGKIRLDVTIKESLRKEGRLFHILRFHENDVSEVGSGRGSVVPIKTDGFSTYAITYEDGADKDDDDDDHEEHKPASWELNPNEKQQLSIVWKGTGTGVSAGYQEQGDIAKGVIKKAVPVGYKEAFSFDLLVNGKTDTSLKSGTMTLTIPAEYLKATVSAGQIGRQYAIIALDRYGKTYFLTDTDSNPNTVTVNVNFEGFAMELIYTG